MGVIRHTLLITRVGFYAVAALTAAVLAVSLLAALLTQSGGAYVAAVLFGVATATLFAIGAMLGDFADGGA